MARILRAHLRRRHSLWMSIATTQTLAARFGGQSVVSSQCPSAVTGQALLTLRNLFLSLVHYKCPRSFTFFLLVFTYPLSFSLH